MTDVERESRRFRGQLGQLLGLTGWTMKELAVRIGCDPATMVRIRQHPYSVDGRWILTIQGLLREELEKLK